MTVAEQEIFQPHLLFMRGEVLLRQDSEEEAEQAFHDAIAFSRRIEDRMGELRATTSLARVLKSRGQEAQARKLLVLAFAGVFEGFDTPYIAAALPGSPDYCRKVETSWRPGLLLEIPHRKFRTMLSVPRIKPDIQSANRSPY